MFPIILLCANRYALTGRYLSLPLSHTHTFSAVHRICITISCTSAFNASMHIHHRCISRRAASAFRAGINLISPAFNRPVSAASSGEFNLDFDLPLRLVERLSDYLTFSITRAATSNAYRSTSNAINSGRLGTDSRYPVVLFSRDSLDAL